MVGPMGAPSDPKGRKPEAQYTSFSFFPPRDLRLEPPTGQIGWAAREPRSSRAREKVGRENLEAAKVKARALL